VGLCGLFGGGAIAILSVSLEGLRVKIEGSGIDGVGDFGSEIS